MSGRGSPLFLLQIRTAGFGRWPGCSHSVLLLSLIGIPANSGGWGVFIGCIAVYVIHAWFYFRSRTLRLTLFLFGVLAILLICNVSGCRAMINTR